MVHTICRAIVVALTPRSVYLNSVSIQEFVKRFIHVLPPIVGLYILDTLSRTSDLFFKKHASVHSIHTEESTTNVTKYVSPPRDCLKGPHISACFLSCSSVFFSFFIIDKFCHLCFILSNLRVRLTTNVRCESRVCTISLFQSDHPFSVANIYHCAPTNYCRSDSSSTLHYILPCRIENTFFCWIFPFCL